MRIQYNSYYLSFPFFIFLFTMESDYIWYAMYETTKPPERKV